MVTPVGLLVPVLETHPSETLQNNTAATYGWTKKFGEPSPFDLANGSTSWISVFRALFTTSYWLVCHAMKIGLNAAQACGFLAGYRNDQLWDFLELGNGGFVYL